MTLPDVHLADEAVAAYVDGVLSPGASYRAERHLGGCRECRAVVAAQREAKVLIAAAPDPELPGGLLARLLEVPMTADLGGSDMVLAVDHGEFAWAPVGRTAPEEPRLVERSRVAAGAVPSGPSGLSGRRPTSAVRPAGPSGPGRERPERPASTAGRVRRGRRGLAVSLAGLALGVIASAASTTAPGSAAPARPGPVPGSSPAKLVVGGNAPMEAGTLRFTRPASQQGTLVSTRSDGR